MNSIREPRGKLAPNSSGLTWPEVTGATPLRGSRSRGIGLEVASWVAGQDYTVLAMLPIDEAKRLIVAAAQALSEGRKPRWAPENEKQPLEKWKQGQPAGKYRSPEEIRACRAFQRRCGVSILTGQSGILVIDIDNEDSWLDLCAGREVPETLELKTHKGRHLIFDDGGKSYKTQTGQLASGIDVRGAGGIELIYDPSQPERHFTRLVEPAPLPGWLADLLPLTGSLPRGKTAARATADKLRKTIEEGIPPGQHDSRMLALALSLVNQGWTAKDRQLWLDHASGILARSGEGTDERGRQREKFSRDRIIGWFDSALDKVKTEGAERDSPESQSVDDFIEENVEWLNEPFLPFGALVIIDGDPGQGKSLITTSMVAHAATGKPVLPFGDPGLEAGEAIHCGMIGAEDDMGRAVRPRLRAAGYTDNRHIWTMGLSRNEDGDIELLTFPEGTTRVHKFINDNNLKLLIIDPISSFIGEKIDTHKEASVRRALAPLAEIARETGCCIVLVRHLSKDGSMKALYRGTGSIAFSAIARSGIITGICPDGQYGIAQVKCAYAEKFEGVIHYSVAAWEGNSRTAVIKWGRLDQSLTADDIVKGPGSRKGPEPEVQDEIVEVLGGMFKDTDTRPVKECMEMLEAAGLGKVNPRTLAKARQRLNIRPIQHFESGKLTGWDWTTRKISASEAD